MEEARFGFYSDIQKERTERYWLYASVDIPGSIVRVTEVSPNPNQPSNFFDRRSVGRVGHCIRMIRTNMPLDIVIRAPNQDIVAGS